jgi:trehalose utilization protein
MTSIRVTVWGEFRHEKTNPQVAAIYPRGMHEAIASHLRQSNDLTISTATLDEPEHGCTTTRVNETDVLIWWGHLAHADVQDAVVDRLHERVLAGMGLIVLHSGHYSRLFRKLMGTSCQLKWRVADDREILWVTRPGHPIVRGIDDHFMLPAEEMYGEFFDVPEPLETILISGFTGGEVFRSGCTWMRGAGKIFYFRPGHETFPTYHDPNVLKVIENAVRWAAPPPTIKQIGYGHRPAGWIDSA